MNRFQQLKACLKDLNPKQLISLAAEALNRLKEGEHDLLPSFLEKLDVAPHNSILLYTEERDYAEYD